MQLLGKVNGHGNIQNDAELIHDIDQLEPGRFTVIHALFEGNVLALDTPVYRVGASCFGADGSVRKNLFPFSVRVLGIFFLCTAHRGDHPVIESLDRIPFRRCCHLPDQLEIDVYRITLVELREHLVAI